MTTPADVTRRSLFAIGGAGAGAALLTACTAGDDSSGSSGGDAGSGSSGATSGSTAKASGDSVALSSIPVGGGASATIDGKPVVLSQPTAGTVVAFSAICPHQGCVVAPSTSTSAERFDCPCHGSRFDGTTGDVLQGPATKGLTALKATVDGDSVTVS